MWLSELVRSDKTANQRLSLRVQTKVVSLTFREKGNGCSPSPRRRVIDYALLKRLNDWRYIEQNESADTRSFILLLGLHCAR